MQQQLELDFTTVPHQQSAPPQSPSRNQEAIAAIDGLQYVENYINEHQHDWLLARIDKHEWLNDLKRRVQHYGFKYDYRARKVNLDMHIGELPEWLKVLSKKLQKEGYTPEVAESGDCQ